MPYHLNHLAFSTRTLTQQLSFMYASTCKVLFAAYVIHHKLDL